MCINLKFKKKDESKFWIFNKEVTKEEWDNKWKIGKDAGEIDSLAGEELK